MTIIEARHLTYTYPRATQPVLQDLCFEIAQGTVTALLGCSGAGKSTLLLALAGIVPEFYEGVWLGSLRVGNVTVEAEATRSPEIVQQVAIAFQVPDTQLVGFRVEETIAFGLENQGVPTAQIRAAIQQVLDELGINHLRDRLTDSLSGGQKQACVLAAMMALDTPIIVLDEPTAALDPSGKELVGRIIKRLKQLGKTLIISDQNLDWFQHLVDEALVLSPTGSLLFNGTLNNFLAHRDLVTVARIPLPSLTALAYELQSYGLNVPVWLNSVEARSWITQHREGLRLGIRNGKVASTTTHQLNGNRQHNSVAVECTSVTFTYPGSTTPAIADVNLAAYTGRILGIIGQNGSGKSTMIRHLNGLLKPQKGLVKVAGLAVTMTVAQMAHHIGIVFQNPDLMLFNETVEQEIFFSLGVSKDAAWQQRRQLEMTELLEQFELSQHRLRSPLALSVGEKQMLAILCALALDPKILVLDEPTFGMDQRGRKQLGQILHQLKQKGKAILCVSHDLPLLAEYADEILVFREGRVECCRSSRELLADTELFNRINVPLPVHVQLANEFFGKPCLTPAELAHNLMTAVV